MSATVAAVPAPDARVSYAYQRGTQQLTRVRRTGPDGRAELCLRPVRGRKAARRLLRVTVTAAGAVDAVTSERSELLP